MNTVQSSGSRRAVDLASPDSVRGRDVVERKLMSSSSEAKLGSARGNGATCVLDDPNLGVISINDHNVQACLCKYCSCGKHKCPGAPFFDPYPKSMYGSQYQRAYMAGSLSRPMRPPKPLPLKNPNQMDLLTIYERDYRPFRVDSSDPMLSPSQMGMQGEGGEFAYEASGALGRQGNEGGVGDNRQSYSGLEAEGGRPGGRDWAGKAEGGQHGGNDWTIGKVGGLRGSQSSRPQYRPRVPKVAPFPKFSGVSSYHVEFPSWGGSNPYYMKRQYDGVPTREMPFEAKSIYTDTFVPTGRKDPFTSKVAEMSKQGSLGHVNSSVKMFTKTSSGSAFQPIAKEFLGVRFLHKYERELTADLAFATTEYKDKYVKQPPMMANPHAIKRELDARANN